MTSRERFDYLIPLVLESEGGLVDHPSDPGGATNFGIAQKFNVERLKRFGIHHVRELTPSHR